MHFRSEQKRDAACQSRAPGKLTPSGRFWLAFFVMLSVWQAALLIVPQTTQAQLPAPSDATSKLDDTVGGGAGHFGHRHRFGWSRLSDAEIEQLPREELARRPMLYWRWWSNQRPRPVLSFAILLIVSLIAVHFMPGNLAPAVQFCQSRFWRAMGSGILFSVLDLTVIRPLFITEICTPLAFLLLAVLQLLMLLGFAVVAHLLGNRVMVGLRLSKLAMFQERPGFSRSISVLCGTLILTLILLIPGIGHLPRLGARLVALLAILGMGALLRSRLGFKQLPN
ncbi:MAG TPA: hypothetical protein V6C72_14985 [Chroococcales cyanobacterium]